MENICGPISSHDSSFERQLEQNLRRIVVTGQSILLAVSGGRDSMAMLHGVTQLRSVLEIPSIIVAHLDHGLRDTAGRDDAELVRSTCHVLNVPFVVSVCEAGQLERASRGSLEEAARAARYDFLHLSAQQRGIPMIATAHHQADQAETVLHNIIRGTGIRGLRGVPERRRLSDTVELIRPMLNIDERTLTEYVQRFKIAFAFDATNDSHVFTRNRIRHQLLPRLAKEFNSEIQNSLVRLAGQAEELLQILDGVAETLLNDAVLERTPQHCRLDVLRLTQQPQAVIRHTMTVLWLQQNWPRRDMSGTHWHRLTTLLFSAPPGALDLPGRIRAELRGNLVALSWNVNPP